MRDHPVQGVGVCMNCFDWKDPDIFEQMEDECGEFYTEEQPNGVVAHINFTKINDGTNGRDDYYLISYNYKPYEKTPFNTLEELKEFYVRALQKHVNNSEQEIRDTVDDIDETYFG